LADVVNLRQKRKEKARSDKEKRAQANRAKFGRTKAQKKADEISVESIRKKLDQHLREDE